MEVRSDVRKRDEEEAAKGAWAGMRGRRASKIQQEGRDHALRGDLRGPPV